MAVDILHQPAVQCVKLPFGDFRFNFRVGRQRLLEEEGAHDVTQSISLEGASYDPAEPMDVLQYAIPIVFCPQSQIRLVARVPRFRQISNGQLPFEQCQFKIKPEHNVQIVGDFVGICADQRAFDLINRPIKLVQRDLLELVRETLPEQRVVVLPEGAAPSDLILPETRLALMHPGRDAISQGRRFQIAVNPLFIEGMPGLVQRAEKGLT